MFAITHYIRFCIKVSIFFVARDIYFQGKRLLLVEIDGVHYSIEDKCPHRGGLISRGKICEKGIICPLHHKI
ncbi:hypothetical protein CWI66_16565 [Halomonas sp. 141]|nr:hypothetical protein CWI66_16565 [Halomonas sp. 141]